jgi:hypothetical protein
VRPLTPLLAKLGQTGPLEILWRHHNAKLAVGMKVKKPRLRQRGDLGRVLHIDDQDGRTAPLLFGEINGLGLGRFQDLVDGFPTVPLRTAASNGSWGRVTFSSIRIFHLLR